MRSRCDGDHKNALLRRSWRRHGRIALKAGIRLAKIIDENLGVAAQDKNFAIRRLRRVSLRSNHRLFQRVRRPA
jgi:hypothetical protein